MTPHLSLVLFAHAHGLLALAPGHGVTHTTHHVASPPLQYWQAIVLGLLQGVAELFPISSIGHTVVFPALFGWHNVVAAESAKESFWLAFIVGLHVGTGVALLIFYRRDWVKIIGAFLRSIADRKIATPEARLAWLIVVATIPAALAGVLLEHAFRVLFTKPLPASIFLIVNGGILGVGEWYRRRHDHDGASEERRSLDTFEYREAGVIGVAQTAALIAGISRAGITMVAGLVRGLSYSDAARFSFLLATPIIFLAGIYKLPDLMGPNGNGVRGQALVGALVAGVAAYCAVAFLTRYFKSKNLLPFAIYCGVAGVLLTIRFA